MDTNVIAVAGAARAAGATDVANDPSGSVAEAQARLEAMCKAQGHLTATTINVSKGVREVVHACQRCGLTDVRTLTAVK